VSGNNRWQQQVATTGGNNSMNIRVHIERVMLEGVDWQPAQRAHFERAFAGELARLLANGDPPTQAGAVPFARAPDAMLPPNPTPHSMGVQVARSVFKSMHNT
jgi:hypothetical protein